jgi:hypothetical protein
MYTNEMQSYWLLDQVILGFKVLINISLPMRPATFRVKDLAPNLRTVV